MTISLGCSLDKDAIVLQLVFEIWALISEHVMML